MTDRVTTPGPLNLKILCGQVNFFSVQGISRRSAGKEAAKCKKSADSIRVLAGLRSASLGFVRKWGAGGLAGFLTVGFLAAVLIGGTGCSRFNRDWRKASAQPANFQGIEGAWDGTWESDANGHNGRLRCLLTRQEDGAYLARFHAKYKKVLGYGYDAVLRVEEEQGAAVFRGAADLGWWAGGKYEYEGKATADDFFSTYKSKHDFGSFRMKRPPPAKELEQGR